MEQWLSAQINQVPPLEVPAPIRSTPAQGTCGGRVGQIIRVQGVEGEYLGIRKQELLAS